MSVLKYKNSVDGSWIELPGAAVNIIKNADLKIDVISAIQGEGTSNYLHFDLTKYHKTGKRFIMFYGLYTGANSYYYKCLWDSTNPEIIYQLDSESYIGAYGFTGWTTPDIGTNGYVAAEGILSRTTLSYDEGILTVSGYAGAGTSTPACAAASAVVIYIE